MILFRFLYLPEITTLNNDNNNNKTGQVELSARQVNYYFKNILVGGACPFIRMAGV